MEAPALTAQQLADVVLRCMPAPAIERIVWFGSRVRGQGRPDSDYDLLVLTQTQHNPAQRLDWQRGMKLAFAKLLVSVDAFVVHEHSIDWQQRGYYQAFVQEALQQGVVIYANKPQA